MVGFGRGPMRGPPERVPHTNQRRSPGVSIRRSSLVILRRRGGPDQPLRINPSRGEIGETKRGCSWRESATLIRWSTQPNSSWAKSSITRNSTIVARFSTSMRRFRAPTSGTSQWHDLVRRKTCRGITCSSTEPSTPPTWPNAISSPTTAASRSRTPSSPSFVASSKRGDTP